MDTHVLLDRYRRLFIVNITIIMIIGIIMVYSSSYMYAKELYGTPFYYIIKQITFSLFGIFMVFIVSKTKKSFWYKYARNINIFMTCLLLLTLFPYIGTSVKGAHRWLDLFGLKFQPGEFIKITITLSSIVFFEHYTKLQKKDAIIYIISLIAPLLIFLAQPDFGTFSICFISMAFVCYLSSFSRKIFYIFLLSGNFAIALLSLITPYRAARLLSFLDPWKNAQSSGFQIIQSYLAFANGHIFGQGLGNSNEKLFYLPEAHNDFIFSVIGEEMGLLGIIFVVFLFFSFVYLGLRMAVLLKDKHSIMLVASMTFLLGLQAFLNMGVVLGLLPTKGLNLPFISYGGSSLVANFILVGLLILYVGKKPLHFFYTKNLS